MQTSLDMRDLWGSRYGNCSAEPDLEIDRERAQFIRSIHAGHGPTCRQYLAASAFLFGGPGDEGPQIVVQLPSVR